MARLQIDSSDGRSSIINDDTLLIWLDETGEENLSDANYPIFGIGGCVVEARHYSEFVQSPWTNLKNSAFHGVTALHAAELKSPTDEQMRALSDFFRDGKFCRIASIISGSRDMVSELRPYETCAKSLLERIQEISSSLHYSEIAIFFESSTRANSLAKEYISRISILRSKGNGQPVELPMQHFFLPKELHEPGLEVADFIVQCAGGEARSRNRTNRPAMRKDFVATFLPDNKTLASFQYLQAVRGRPQIPL